MKSIEFFIEKEKLFMIHHQKSFFLFPQKQKKTEISSLGFFYTYNEEVVRDSILDNFFKQKSIPVLFLTSSSFYLIERLKKLYPQDPFYGINLFERTVIDNPTENVFFQPVPSDFKERIIKQNQNNGLSIIATDSKLYQFSKETLDEYKSHYFNYLSQIVSSLNEFKKTIFMIQMEIDLFSNEEMIHIHQQIKKIKELGHIVIFMFRSYHDISDYSFSLFGEDNLYEQYVVSTMGHSNYTLAKLHTKNIYHQLPKILKDFLIDKKLNSYLHYNNFNVPKYNLTVLYDWTPVHIIKNN